MIPKVTGNFNSKKDIFTCIECVSLLVPPISSFLFTLFASLSHLFLLSSSLKPSCTSFTSFIVLCICNI